MTDIDYAARVAKGVALLDAKRPDWAQEISLEILDIASGYACVTAQLSGEQNWRVGMKQLDLTSGDDGSYIAHGFNVENCGGYHTDVECPKNSAYAKLNTLWREVIEGRLSASPEPAAG